MSEEIKSDAALYIEEKKIADVKAVEAKTPLGDNIYEVSFENGFGPSMLLTQKKYAAVRTMEKSDATSARDRLTKKLGAELYALMLEYGIKFSEVDPCLNEIVRLINDGQNRAIDHLWGNDAHARSLLDVNRVLLEKYESTKEAADEKGDDGAASAGSTPDTEAEKQV